MKTKISLLLLAISIIACTSNKQNELSKLKVQKQALDEKIKVLEEELANQKGDSLNTSKFKLVGVKEIVSGPFDHYIRVQGKLDGDQMAAVFAQAPGTIIAKYADVGQRVSKGQVLAQVDDEQYRKQLEGLETQFRFALEMYEKQKRLWDQKIGSEVQYLQSKTTKESLEQQIASVRKQIEMFKIKSPIDGTIEECNIKIGGVVSPDPRLVAYRVVAFKNLKVSAEVSEAYSSRVKEGDKLIVVFPDIQKQIETKVSFVSKYINPVNRTFTIETKLNEVIPHLKANMIAIIQINDYHTENAITLPMNLIQADQLGSYVYVARSMSNYYSAIKQPVTIGNSYNGLAEIVNGLKPGDKVISTGYQELFDGEYIRL